MVGEAPDQVRGAVVIGFETRPLAQPKGARRTVVWRSNIRSTALYGSRVLVQIIGAQTSTPRQTAGTVRRVPGAAGRLVPGRGVE